MGETAVTSVGMAYLLAVLKDIAIGRGGLFLLLLLLQVQRGQPMTKQGAMKGTLRQASLGLKQGG